MHPADAPPPAHASFWDHFLWVKLLNRYQWFVLVVAALGWLFDTMDQQLFVLARGPALTELLEGWLGHTPLEGDLDHYGGIATCIFMLGWATGGLIFGLFGDRLGRVRTLVMTILLYSIFTGLSALSTGWLDFALFRFLTGMGVGGEFAAGVSLVAEVMPAAARPYAIALLQALSAIGNVTAAIVSLIIPPQQELTFLSALHLEGVQGWRLMFLVGVLPAFVVVLILRGLKEPESWVRAKQASQDDFSKQMGDLRQLFGDPGWRYHTIIGILLAMAGIMGLWGVGFWTPELIRKGVLAGEAKSVQDWYASWGQILSNGGAFFGIYAFSIIAGMMGRRTGFAISFVLALGATVLVFGFMTASWQIWLLLPLLGFCNLMVFGGFAVYFPELYPTRLRATGVGFCYNVARYLAAVAPLALGGLVKYVYSAPADTERFANNLSYLTVLSSLGGADHPLRYAALTVALIYIGGLLVLPFAPETRGKELPE
jgi:MFS family permease